MIIVMLKFQVKEKKKSYLVQREFARNCLDFGAIQFFTNHYGREMRKLFRENLYITKGILFVL